MAVVEKEQYWGCFAGTGLNGEKSGLFSAGGDIDGLRRWIGVFILVIPFDESWRSEKAKRLEC